MRFARTALGMLLALVGLVVSFAGAAAAFWLVGPDDTVHAGDQRLSTDGLAVVTAPGLLSRHGPVLHVTATGDRPVFVGVGRDFDVSSYLVGSTYERLVRFGLPASFDDQQLRGRTTPLPAPEGLDWWVVQAAGEGRQSVQWPMADGRYSVVVMNADGTPGVDVTVGFGIELAGAFGTSLVVLGLGLVGLACGCTLAFSRRRLAEPVRVVMPVSTQPVSLPNLMNKPAPRLNPAPRSMPVPGVESVPGVEPTGRAEPTGWAESVRDEPVREVETDRRVESAQEAGSRLEPASEVRAAPRPLVHTPRPKPEPVVDQPAPSPSSTPVEPRRPEPAIRYHPASRYLLTAHQNRVEQQQAEGGLLLKERQAEDDAPASGEPGDERRPKDTTERAPGAERVPGVERAPGVKLDPGPERVPGVERAPGVGRAPGVEPVSESEYQANLRKTAALLASGAVLLSATGCLAAPELNTSRPESRPAITLADGLALVRKYNEITNKAHHTRDAKLSATVQADPTLTQTQASFRVGQVLQKSGQVKPYSSTEPEIGVPEFGSYPMRFVVSAGVSGAPETHQLAVWERRSAGAPWVVTHSVYPAATAKLPSMDHLRVPDELDLADLSVAPRAAADSLAAYLTGGAKAPQAKQFVPSPGVVNLLTERARSAAADTAEAYIAGVSDTFSVRGEPVTFITATGDALVFLALSERYLQRVEPGMSAYWTTGAATAFSNRIKYGRSLHQDYLHQVALVIPTQDAAGPIRILSIDGQLVNAGGT